MQPFFAVFAKALERHSGAQALMRICSVISCKEMPDSGPLRNREALFTRRVSVFPHREFALRMSARQPAGLPSAPPQAHARTPRPSSSRTRRSASGLDLR